MKNFNLTLGIYEKAMPASLAWSEKLAMAKAAGYDFVEISIDESDQRLKRLDWSVSQRTELRDEILKSGILLTSMCLSGLRRFPLGSKNDQMRQRSLDILKKSIDFALDTGVKIILVPGYDVFYEESDKGTEERFIDSLFKAKDWASWACVMLALENTDKYITSLKQARKIIDHVNSTWFKLYGDIGNLVAAELDPFAELEWGRGHLAGIHLKDALPGKMRRIPFGEGTVPFIEIFQKLSEIKFSGPVMLEMWEDSRQDPLKRISEARTWVQEQYKKANNPHEDKIENDLI